jgi:hypothetical protein
VELLLSRSALVGLGCGAVVLSGVDIFIRFGHRVVSYLVFIPKPCTHRMHDPGSIVPHIWPKVSIDNQMSQIMYNYYYTNSLSKDNNNS